MYQKLHEIEIQNKLQLKKDIINFFDQQFSDLQNQVYGNQITDLQHFQSSLRDIQFRGLLISDRYRKSICNVFGQYKRKYQSQLLRCISERGPEEGSLRQRSVQQLVRFNNFNHRHHSNYEVFNFSVLHKPKQRRGVARDKVEEQIG